MFDQIGSEIKPGDTVAIQTIPGLITVVVMEVRDDALIVAWPIMGFDTTKPAQGIVKTFMQRPPFPTQPFQDTKKGTVS